MEHIVPGKKLQSGASSWTIVKKLGAGSWGAVFEATRVVGSSASSAAANPTFALKVVPLAAVGGKKGGKSRVNDEAGLLNMESMMYTNILRWHPSLPVVPLHGSGEDGSYRWLALQKMDATLNGRLNGQATDVATACTVALQLLDVLSHIHSCGFIFRDLNADNVMTGGPQPGQGTPGWGVNAQPGAWDAAAKTVRAGLHAPMDTAGERVYLLDFGLATKYSALAMGSSGGAAKPAVEAGTPLFSSSSAARGKPMGPRDDLECLGYLLVYMMGGRASLPWHAGQSIEEAQAGKVAATPASLAAAVPKASPAAGPIVKAFFTALEALPYGGSSVDYSPFRACLMPHAAKDGRLEFKAVGAGAKAKAAGAGAGAASAAASPAKAAAPVKQKAKKETREPGAGAGAGAGAGSSASAPAKAGTKRKATAPRGGRRAAATVADDEDEDDVQLLEDDDEDEQEAVVVRKRPSKRPKPTGPSSAPEPELIVLGDTTDEDEAGRTGPKRLGKAKAKAQAAKPKVVKGRLPAKAYMRKSLSPLPAGAAAGQAVQDDDEDEDDDGAGAGAGGSGSARHDPRRSSFASAASHGSASSGHGVRGLVKAVAAAGRAALAGLGGLGAAVAARAGMSASQEEDEDDGEDEEA